jgi:hypothetical protein
LAIPNASVLLDGDCFEEISGDIRAEAQSIAV